MIDVTTAMPSAASPQPWMRHWRSASATGSKRRRVRNGIVTAYDRTADTIQPHSYPYRRGGQSPVAGAGPLPCTGASRRPRDGDTSGLVRVLLQPAPGERAEGHHREPVRGGVVEGGAHQLAADTLTLQRRGHAGVDQHQAAAMQPVDELGDVAVLGVGEAAGGLFVDDRHC